MKIQAINAYNNQPSFGAIKHQDGLLKNKNRESVFDYITGKLNEIDPSDRLNRSYVERAERWEHDILFTKGEKNNSVRVDVVPQHLEKEATVYNGISINDHTHVGTYSKPEQFDIQHFNNVYIPSEKTTKIYIRVMTSLFGVIVAAAVGIMGFFIKKEYNDFNIKDNNTTVVAKDTLKTDSIKPMLEDSFKLGKKFIKK